jgi:SWIM zinc finger
VVTRDFSCSCPDFHRSGPGCKHALAVYTLARVAKLQAGHARPRSERGCEHCVNGWISLTEDLVDSSSGEVVHAENLVRCQRCQPREAPYMTPSEMEEWMAGARWRYAVSMPKHPHDYSLREWNDEETFVRVCKTIWDRGYDRRYIGRRWRTLDIGEHHYVWLHSRPEEHDAAPIEITELINRAVRHQSRLV